MATVPQHEITPTSGAPGDADSIPTVITDLKMSTKAGSAAKQGETAGVVTATGRNTY